MKDNIAYDKLVNHPKIRSIGLKPEAVMDILKIYQDISLDILLENGRIELGNGMIIEVVQLTDRVHVLRGTPYRNSRRYKLKLTMEEPLYQKIEEYYNKLEEEIS